MKASREPIIYLITARLTDVQHRYETVIKRWPIILTKLIDTVHNINHNLTIQANSQKDGQKSSTETLPREHAGSEVLDLTDWEEKVSEGRGIIEKVSKLKYEMARDRDLL
jgi:hypothetical protein